MTSFQRDLEIFLRLLTYIYSTLKALQQCIM